MNLQISDPFRCEIWGKQGQGVKKTERERQVRSREGKPTIKIQQHKRADPTVWHARAQGWITDRGGETGDTPEYIWASNPAPRNPLANREQSGKPNPKKNVGTDPGVHQSTRYGLAMVKRTFGHSMNDLTTGRKKKYYRERYIAYSRPGLAIPERFKLVRHYGCNLDHRLVHKNKNHPE